MKLPRLYAIADMGALRGRGVELRQFAEELRTAGVSLVQLRDKDGSPEDVLHTAALLRNVLGDACMLVMNDRVDLALLAGFDGVHVGQTDLSPRDARAVADRGTGFVVGVSTHNDAQVRLAEGSPANYVAVGPVFATGTKADAEPVVGLEGVRRARALTAKPLVAIGGITRGNCRSIIEAGADSVAVISALILPDESVQKVARDILDILR